MTVMKFIFLDIDGVLNSENWFKEHSADIKASSGFLHRGMSELDPAALTRLRKIVNETGAHLVLSSSWRYLHPLHEIESMFAGLGFSNLMFYDYTPRSKDNRRRGEEIAEWIQKFKETTTNLELQYVILDDDSDMLFEQKPFFVHTSWATGLTDMDVEIALNMFDFQEGK